MSCIIVHVREGGGGGGGGGGVGGGELPWVICLESPGNFSGPKPDIIVKI